MPRQSQSLGFFSLYRAGVAAFLASFLLFAGPASAKTLRLVALGDSLTAGYQLPPQDAFPAALEKALKAKGWDIKVANAGVSGDTAAQGAARVDWSVPDGTDGVILELGANDALRGLPPEAAKASLEKILERLKARKIPVLIAGMYAPRSLGADYYEKFDAIYPDLAKKYGAELYPFFLDGVAGQVKLNLEDGLHPTGEGIRAIVERILPSVESFLRRIQTPS
ncbi:arylesterase [Terrihabitans soli]|uniref:Arylesterase n=1 Tax=Terrihabitans soli TaxID=708113 RepID=A0A6S6QKS6_9HYPH|nr:arylesterase [Terrihabitans soli]BCJ89489.1 arylesterase [Terrihabitans soli]